ncbi:MAG: polysaccharide deacetylase, partial [Betaproteobacteria bacterium]|nr:polysaccharide deacetylase [Betaproteobacteria bacterium]
PNGARVAVWVIPNVEHFHLEIGSPAPDVRNFSRRDYGNRVGLWRLMDVLNKHRIRGTVALNAEIGIYYPRIMQAMIDLDWELMGHGLTNSKIMSGLEIEAERKLILDTRKVIEDWGRKMHGWLGPGLTETFNTPDLLKECGVEYVADWVNDDLPYRFNNGLYSIPYSIEINDMPLFNMPSISIEDFKRRICDSFDVLYAEGATNGRVLGIALHPFLIGAAHRIKYLDEALQYIAGHDKVWFATGDEIIRAYKAQETKA